MREIKKTDSEIVIFENNQNQLLETFISMKFDAECNETTPAILFPRFHEDVNKLETRGKPSTYVSAGRARRTCKILLQVLRTPEWTDVQLSSRYIYDDGYLDAQVSRIPEEFVRSVTQDPPNRSGPHYVQMLDPAVRPDALDLVSDLLAPTRKGKSALFK